MISLSNGACGPARGQRPLFRDPAWACEGFGESVLLAAVDDEGDGRDELLIGEGAPEAYTLVVVERRGIELVATGAEYRVDYTPLPTTTPNTWSSFGCADVDGVRRLVAYRFELIGGDSIETASEAIVTTVFTESGTDVDERTYQLPAELMPWSRSSIHSAATCRC